MIGEGGKEEVVKFTEMALGMKGKRRENIRKDRQVQDRSALENHTSICKQRCRLL